MRAANDTARRKAPNWTPEEEAILRAGYRGNARELAERLGRSLRSVYVRAERLGLSYQPHWSAADDELLRREWQEVGMQTLMDKLPGRTRGAIHHRAKDLGLPRGVPQGYVPMAVASRRAGLAFDAFKSLLERAGIRPVRIASRKKKGRYSRLCVEPEQIDEAMAFYNATETLRGAERARDLPRGTLSRWLREAGVIAPKGDRRHHRVLSETIDNVVAARRAAPRRRAA